MTRHFFKVLFAFAVIVALGFVGYIVLINMDQNASKPATANVDKAPCKTGKLC